MIEHYDFKFSGKPFLPPSLLSSVLSCVALGSFSTAGAKREIPLPWQTQCHADGECRPCEEEVPVWELRERGSPH